MNNAESQNYKLMQFKQQGYIIQRETFSKQVADKFIEECDPQVNDNYCLPVPFRHSDFLFKKILDSKILYLTLLNLLEGKNPCLFGGEYFIKPAGQKGFPPHFDNQDLKLKDHNDCIIFWLALEPVNANNGGLCLYPKSHLIVNKAYPSTQNAPNRSDIDYYAVKKEDLDKLDRPIYPALNRGDAIFFSSNLVHSSTTNHTAGTRKSLQLSFIAENVYANPGLYQKRIPLKFSNS